MSDEVSHLMKLVKPLYKYATDSWQLNFRYSKAGSEDDAAIVYFLHKCPWGLWDECLSV